MSDRRMTSWRTTVRRHLGTTRRLAVVTALLAGLAGTAALADTVTYRQGASGYTGVVDTFLQQNPANAGTNNGAALLLGWDGDDPSGTGNDVYTLLRFDSIIGTGVGQIPPGATITSATLSYVVSDIGDTATIHRVLTAGWTAAATFTSFCGASCDQGNEFGPSDGNAGAAALGTQTVDVTAGVQAWANGSPNNGWFFLSAGTGGVDIRSSEHATVSERPLLTVIFNQGAPSAGIVRQPYLQQGTPTSMQVVWRTDTASNSRVRYGTVQTLLDQEATNATVSTDHVVAITGLLPATRYYYDAGSSTTVQAGGTVQHFFETSPTTGAAAPFRVWVLGDSGSLSAQQLNVRNSMLAFTAANPPDLLVHVGDIAYDSGTEDEFTQKHFGVYQDILRHTVSWTTLGNHEGLSTVSGSPGTSSGPYYTAFVLPSAGNAGGEPSGTEAYYSFDYANVHFICLNSTQVSRAANGPMAQWLQADLASATAQWVIAFWHHPPYSKGTHNSDTEVELVQMRENIMPILEAGGVDLVLNGHSHAYERSYLIDGTYSTPTPGFATLLGAGHIVDDGDGRPTGDGAYLKSPGPNAHEGEVMVVAGHGGSSNGGSLNHPVMYHSESAHGSVILDIDGSSLNATNLRSDGVVTDSFSIVKGDLPPRISQAVPPKEDILASLSSLAVTFSTAVTGVDAGDLTINGSPATTLACDTCLAGAGAGPYVFSVFGTPGPGTVSVNMAAGGIADAGNAALLFSGDSWIYVIDTTPPVVTATAPPRGGHTSLLGSIAVTFSKPVVNVTPDDLTVNGSPATQVTGLTGTPGPYTFSGYTEPAPGLVNVVLVADGIQDTQTPIHAFAGDAWTYVRTQGLVINEFLASNNTTVTDENGEFDDYVEIYNPGVDPVDMGGMFLTDQLGFPAQYRIPQGVTIPAGGHLVFWCDSQPSQGSLHTNFNILRTGEQLGLYSSEEDGIQPIDTLTFTTQTTDVAFGRFPDGSASFVSMPATPNAANTTNCATAADCSALNGPCTSGICSGTVCVAQAINEGGACSTGVACLTGETCGGGVCDGGSSTCGAGETCNLDTGLCTVVPAPALPIAVGATWRYLPGTAEPDPAWKTQGFDDTAWTSGASGFGYGPDCATTALRGTTLGTMQNNYVSLYTRRAFSIPNPTLVTSLSLTMDYDDGWVAYLNGVEVARSPGMGGTPGVPPAFSAVTQTADRECSTGSPANPPEVYDLTPFLGLLQAGNNLLAIQGHNRAATSSDFSLIASLTATQVAGCATSADCSDGNPCTDDVCDLGTGTCTNVADNTNLCSDSVACTTDICSDGLCASTTNCAFGQTCDTGTGQCTTASATVTFQDGTAGYTGTVDTFLHAGLPTANNAAAATLIVDGQPPVADERQVLLRFDGLFASEGGPILDGVVVLSATLTLNITNPSATGADLHRMLIPWADTDTWDTEVAGVQANDAEAAAAIDVTSLYNGTVPATHAIDVTTSVAAWAAGAANHGWALLTPVGGSDSWQFDSSEGPTVSLRPRLSVTYSTAQSCITDGDCDDSNACNGIETCSGGTCQAGSPLTCNDGNACTTDTCSPVTGCVFTDNNAACSDGSACTTGDVCSGGVCAGTLITCDDGVACTADSCNPATGCVAVDACTGGLTCNLGTGLCEAAPAQAVFQDGVGGYAATVDTFLHAGSPTTNNAATNPLIVDGPLAGAPGDERQVLMRFDNLFVSQGGPIPDGATILAATLRLNITNVSPDGAELHRMIAPWVDTDTWNSLVGGVARDGVESVAAIDVQSSYNGTVPAAHDINVTPSVVAWSANPAANRGWIFVTPTGLSDSWQFSSSEDATVTLRPQLTVQYQAFTGPRARIDCALAAPDAPPGGLVGLDLTLTNLGGLTPVRGYQTKILATRTAGSGTVGLTCPGGVAINEARGDYIFAGQPATFPITNCGLALASSSLLSGAASVGPGAAYLSTYALTVSGDAAPGSSFEISLAAFPDTALADSGANPIAWESGPVCTLTVSGECNINAQCNDGNPCTDDLCTAGTCTHPANTASCDDGNPCTTGDICGGGVCTGGAPVVCNDGNPCTDDTCNPANGACESVNDNSNTCSDGDACTPVDACVAGVCVPGTPISCDDGNICTADSCSAGACLHAPSGACGVSGVVTYYRNGTTGEPSVKPVPSVGVDASGDLVADDTSGAAGTYAIGNLAGTIGVTPTPKYGDPRASDHNGAITSFDASLAAQHAVLQITLSGNQQIAGDVTGNGAVSSFDAALISQFAVQVIDHFAAAGVPPGGSDWRFLRCDNYVDAGNHDCGPASYTHAPLVGPVVDNFVGILLGDVSGNWAPAAPLAPPRGAEALAVTADTERAQALRQKGMGRPTAAVRPGSGDVALLSLDGWSKPLAAGSRRTLLVTVRNADGIEGLDLDLGFDPARLSIVSVETDGIGADHTAIAHQAGGSARVAVYGPVPLSGSGTVVKITVEARTDLGRTLPMTIGAEANEGRVSLRIKGAAGAGGPKLGRPVNRQAD